MNSDKTVDSASVTPCEGGANTITPAAVPHSNQCDPRLVALVKHTLDLESDDDDDDVVNQTAKKAERTHIADDDDANVIPLKDATSC